MTYQNQIAIPTENNGVLSLKEFALIFIVLFHSRLRGML
jgi:hypothetical protein